MTHDAPPYLGPMLVWLGLVALRWRRVGAGTLLLSRLDTLAR